MVGELITLPLRVGVRATKLWLRTTEETVAVLANATSRLIDTVMSRETPPAEFARDARWSEPPTRPSEATWSEPLTSASPLPAAVADDVAAEPAHVSEQPELVEEVAEPRAEDGAGAEVHVQEPWAGYERMRAGDVVDQIAGATPAELAAIQLYEGAGKRRVTVLEAVERELRISHSSG
jgi:hypothetical protein